ncbi:MAG: hypothetical protein LBK94_06735 [Prevotellaceae bacterium]|jgi:hypothetical protein|nr:hypothetical protein [Prevotellaceae bacterium]
MDSATLIKIRNFGALNYSPERIADLLGYIDEQRRTLLVAFTDDGSDVAVYYKQVQAIGKYNIDAQLAKNAERGDTDAAMVLQTRRKTETVDNLKKQLFGIV